METEFRNFIGKEVKRLFLVLWPPTGEKEMSNVDISIGLILSDNKSVLYVLSTDQDDNWTPCIMEEHIPNRIYPWNDFKIRIIGWMRQELPDDLEKEYYEVTNVWEFSNIVSNKIKDIQLIKINNKTPFGVRLLFDCDFIQSTPISDGNTVETKNFNQNNNIQYFEKIGKIEFESIAKIS